VERCRRSTGGTLQAARAALDEAAARGWGVAVNLAGGTHHACPDHGEGFCVFNDAAVAIRVLQREGRIQRAVVLDCDVHQGNGTAAAFRADPSVFTFSIHGARNFPFRKERGSLDVELPDGAGDDVFLAALEMHVPQILDDFRPELAVYLAGADPWREDRFGRLGMSKEGLMARDRLVLSACRDAGIPVAVAMAGGYARDTEDTVDIHVRTIAICAEMWESIEPQARMPDPPNLSFCGRRRTVLCFRPGAWRRPKNLSRERQDLSVTLCSRALPGKGFRARGGRFFGRAAGSAALPEGPGARAPSE
jgi:acetoin utilization deacetylase AcuC-like enzyme